MAYAAVMSLIRVLENILQHPRISHHPHISHQQENLEALLEKLNFLQDFLENTSPRRSEVMECLEGKIRDASYEAEDIIESHLVNNLLQQSEDESYKIFCQNIEKIMEEMDSITKEAKKIKNGGVVVAVDMQSKSCLLPEGSSGPNPHANISTVGIDDDLLQIKDQLTRLVLGVQTISIVGMGGIGKTTFAQKVFNDSLIISHFDIRAWVTVSQTYSVRNILVDILDSMNEKMGGSDENLAVHVHKTLKDRRYFIVLDDVWDNDVWDSVKRLFPDDNIGSRIMLTTRLESVATYANSCELHHMRLLSMEVSWSLLHNKLFSDQECCPPQLEETGKKIVESSGGLPLSIVEIGGLLSKVEKTEECWRNVAQDLDLIAITKTEKCSNVFSMSYQHLPHSLRPCLLYMGAFPEDYHIPVSKLTKIWVAEGFLKKAETKSWEEVAQGNLEELIERSLIFVRKKRRNGKAKTCGIHDLLRDFCLMEAKKEKFLQVAYKHQERLDVQRRISCVGGKLLRLQKLNSIARTVLLFHGVFLFNLFSSPLLRILDSSQNHFNSPKNFVNIRFIGYPWENAKAVVPLVSKMWNLQTLIIYDEGHPDRMGSSFHLPEELWNMQQLRHIIYRDGVYLPDHDAGLDGKSQSYCVLENLQTISVVKNLRCTEEVLKRIPNIKKLGICFRDFDYKGVNWSYYCLYNLVHLQKLETLKLCCISDSDLRIVTLPHTLRNLTLLRVDNYWKHLGVIGSLPNLEVFRVEHCSLGDEWEPVDGQFCRLKFMLLKRLSLVHWRADCTHFPCLEHLIIDDCSRLEEIPCDIGDITTLEKIELVDVDLSVFNSTKKLVEDQRRSGNDELQVFVWNSSWNNVNKKMPECKL